MRSAFCLAGKVGGTQGKDMVGKPVDFKMCYETYKEHIIDVNNCDVFIHCWNVEYEEQLKELYQPKKAIFEPQITNFHPGVERSMSGFRLDSGRYSWKQSVRLKSEYEKENNFKYDWVMLCRFDMLFFVDLDFSKLDPFKFYLPICNLSYHYDKSGILHEPQRTNLSLERGVRFSDVFFVGSSGDMDRFSTLFDYLLGYSECADKATWAHLVKVFGKNFRKKIDYILYRWWDYEMYRFKVCGCYK